MLQAFRYTLPCRKNVPGICEKCSSINKLQESDDYGLSSLPADVIRLAKTHAINGQASWRRPTAENVLCSINALDPQFCDACNRVTFFNCLIHSFFISFSASFYGTCNFLPFMVNLCKIYITCNFSFFGTHYLLFIGLS